jgi:hypothetical protein
MDGLKGRRRAMVVSFTSMRQLVSTAQASQQHNIAAEQQRLLLLLYSLL